MFFHRSRFASATFLSVPLCLSIGCGGEEVKYKPRPAFQGNKASLPGVPNLPQNPIKNGDAYTVWGASYYLRSRVHRSEVAKKKLSLVGYITKTNLMDAPECAVHKGGEADPEDCKAPVPTFWLGDTKNAADKDSMKVMGWASNFAQIFDAMDEFDKTTKDDEEAEYLDEFWGVNLPNPLPAKGAKVKVTGTYATTFTQSSAGTEADPIMGILTYLEMNYEEEPPELAQLPGKKRKAKD